MSDQAFPVPPSFDGHTQVHPGAAGLSKRELLAGMAMQGILASGELLPDDDKLVKWSLEYADALLAALKTSPSP